MQHEKIAESVADAVFPMIARWLPDDDSDLDATMALVIERIAGFRLVERRAGRADIWERNGVRIASWPGKPKSILLPHELRTAAERKDIYGTNPLPYPAIDIAERLDAVSNALCSLQGRIAYALAYGWIVEAFVERYDDIRAAGVTHAAISPDGVETHLVYWSPRGRKVNVLEKIASEAAVYARARKGDLPEISQPIAPITLCDQSLCTWLLGPPEGLADARAALVPIRPHTRAELKKHLKQITDVEEHVAAEISSAPPASAADPKP